MSEWITPLLIGLGYGVACLLGREYRQWKRQRNLTDSIERQRAEDQRKAEAEIEKAETEWIPKEIEIWTDR